MSDAEEWLTRLSELDEETRREIVIGLLQSLSFDTSEIKFNCSKCSASVSADSLDTTTGLCYFCQELGDQHVHTIRHKAGDPLNYCATCSESWECKKCRSVSALWGHADTHVEQCGPYYWCCKRYYWADGPAHR